jgi:signal transduction histidine kinase
MFSGMVQVLQLTDLTSEQEEAVETVYHAGGHLEQTIADVLQMSMIESGGIGDGIWDIL